MSLHTSTPLDPSFSRDIENLHLIYDYAAENPRTHAPEKWRYEMWFVSSTRVVYAIHGGPMAGRTNFQAATYQCVRPGELWKVNWLEETGTVCSLVYDIPGATVTTLIAFSKGHWDDPEAARGDKRNAEDFERWRGLGTVGGQAERFLLSERGQVVERFWGKGELQPISGEEETL